MATPDLIRLDIVVDEEQYDTAAGLLVRNISYGWEEDSLPTGETRFRVHCDNAIVQENLAKTHANNDVTSIVFDFRGYDTMCEAFILITAVTGSAVILFKNTGKEKKKDEQ